MKAKNNFIAIMLLLITGCESFFFYPEKEFLLSPYVQRYTPEDIYFKTSDGLKLHGWLLRAKGYDRGTILHLHGNAENISTHINGVIWLVDEGFNIFSFDYRGYGKSEGVPSIHGIHLDAEAALEKTFEIPGINLKNVFVLGQSLGAAVAVYTVATSKYKTRIKALILDSPFSSYRRIAREKASEFMLTFPMSYIIQFFVTDTYSPEIWIEKLHPSAIFIIHGENDRIIPSYHSLILYAKVKGIKELLIVPDADHIEGLNNIQARRRIIEFINSFTY